ncbi:UNVERIFIED_CONTAM: catechol 2,3-dioxygenase-like lactoylglutathione lyase family enzyme [Paenibacillus sp. PvR008]
MFNTEKTSEFYSRYLGFRAVSYLEAEEPHICLYRDDTEIILTKSLGQKVVPNKEFVIEDVDGRWIGFGIKESNSCHFPAMKVGCRLVLLL